MTAEGQQSIEELLRQLGTDPTAVARETDEFGKDARYFSAQYARLAEQYDGEFVAVYHGCVRAHATDLESVLQELRDQGIDPGQTPIRFVSRQRRTLIL